MYFQKSKLSAQMRGGGGAALYIKALQKSARPQSLGRGAKLRFLAVFFMAGLMPVSVFAADPAPRLINTDSGINIVYPHANTLDEKKAQLRHAETRNAEVFNRLSECRNACVEDCLSSDSACSYDLCDQGQCQADRQEHEAYQRAVAQLTTAVQRAPRAETANADSTATSNAKSPRIIYGSHTDLASAQSAFTRAQTAFSQRSYHLNKCRESCLANCRSSGSSSCSNTACDQGQCKTPRQDYDETQRARDHYAQNVKNLKTAQTNRANQAMKGGTRSALQQVRESKENMGLYGWMGVGTTALLGYMSYTCCSSLMQNEPTGFKKLWAWIEDDFIEICAKPLEWVVAPVEAGFPAGLTIQSHISPAPGMNSMAGGAAQAAQGAGGGATAPAAGAESALPCTKLWCGIYVAGTVAAGLQTYKIFQQKNKLKTIEKALCEKNSETGACSDNSSENSQQMLAETPYCRENPSRCEEARCAIDPTSPSCNTESTGDIAQRLSSIYNWPEGRNPFGACDQTPSGTVCSAPARNAEQFELSPEEQALLDEAMGQHKSQQKAYLNNKGTAWMGVGTRALLDYQAKTPKEDLTAFTAGPEDLTAGVAASLTALPNRGGSHPDATARAPAQGLANQARTGSLSRQMDKSLNKYYQDGRGEDDPYQGRFVSFGPGKTPVGVKEDNLFLMQHRLYRKLSLTDTFLSHRPRALPQGSR